MTDGFAYRLAGPIGSKATLGLVVLQVDETIERDFRLLCRDPGIALHVTRIPSGADLTPGTIATMEHALPAAAGLLPQATAFDCVGYGCTSATAQIGQDRVANLVSGAVNTAAVTDPLTATLAACSALGVRRIGIVSPYTADVGAPITQAMTAAGLDVARTLSFGEKQEARVARIDPASILQAVETVGADTALDAVFVSCTNLRAYEVVDQAEDRIGRPVLTSNLALGWHMFRQTGAAPANAPGQLFRL